MIDPHPLRVWRQDHNLGVKLDAWRQYVKKSQKKYGGPHMGIQPIEMDIPIDPAMTPDFLNLQALLYMQNNARAFISHFDKFWYEHRQMFQLDAALAESLNKTEVGDVPWEEVRDPCPEYHISWGDFGQETFSIREFEYVVDGAYVRRCPKSSVIFPNDTLLIMFTSQLVWPSYREAKEIRKCSGAHFSDPLYDYAISGANASTIGEAISQGEDEYRMNCIHQDQNIYEVAHQLAPTVEVTPTTEKISPHIDKFKRGVAVFRDFIPLLFNSIFYLTQQFGEREERYTENAPRGKIRSLESSRNEAVRKSKQEALLRKGYSTVIFVREPNLSTPHPSQSTGRGIRSHWRRGHWRHQPCGKSLEQRKWLWIKPVLVKKDEELLIGTKRIVDSNKQ